MKITKKKLIPTLVLVLTGVSLVRLLKIAISTTSYSPSASSSTPTLLNECSSSSPACRNITAHKQGTLATQPVSLSDAGPHTVEELQFLSDIVSRRAPCNLLVFGLERQHLVFSSFNSGGTTVFLEDNPDKLNIIKSSSDDTRVYKVEYKTRAKEAYKLLNYARKNPGCSPHTGLRKASRCKLELLTELPQEVYDLKWDVVVVDGPSGDGPEAPGRMGVIYTSSILARRGKMTDVVVHDVDRTVEKWFSREFLCEKNLISSKGKFWNFRIAQPYNSTSFCPINN